MKNRILNLRIVKWISGLRISKYLSSHRFFGRIFNYETISYIFFGVLTTAVNYIVFFLMPRFESGGLDLVLANTAAWIAAVLFAFVVNKIFVFDSPSWNRGTVFREFFPFITARLLSLLFDDVFVWLTAGVFKWNEPLMKILSSIFVLLANYFASKFIIFRKKDQNQHEQN